MSFGKVRGQLYKSARLLGDLNAISRGPEKMIQRAIRKKAGRMTGKGLASTFSKLFK